MAEATVEDEKDVCEGERLPTMVTTPEGGRLAAGKVARTEPSSISSFDRPDGQAHVQQHEHVDQDELA